MTIHLKTKEFKDILKSFTKFSQHSHKAASITFAFDPFRMVMNTDHAYIDAQPKASVQPPLSMFTFNPEVINNLTLSGPDVALYWENSTSPLHLKCGPLATSLRVAVPAPSFENIPENMHSVDLPLGILIAINKYLSIPFSYFKGGKKELMPVTFKKNEKGNLTVQADDGYSLARIDTEIPIDIKDFEIKVPKYMLESLYGKGDLDDETPSRIGVKDTKSFFSNGTMQIFTSGMNDEVSDFNEALSSFKATTSCEFVPKTLIEAIKPLVSILPKKDRSATILKVKLTNQMDMSLKHTEIGDGIVKEVQGVENIYHENSQTTSTINMHPQSFQEYTNLFTVEKGLFYANQDMVHYDGEIESGGKPLKVEYLFPTVQL